MWRPLAERQARRCQPIGTSAVLGGGPSNLRPWACRGCSAHLPGRKENGGAPQRGPAVLNGHDDRCWRQNILPGSAGSCPFSPFEEPGHGARHTDSHQTEGPVLEHPGHLYAEVELEAGEDADDQEEESREEPSLASFWDLGCVQKAQVLRVAEVDQLGLAHGVDDVEDPHESDHEPENAVLLVVRRAHSDQRGDHREEGGAAKVEAVIDVSDAGEEGERTCHERALPQGRRRDQRLGGRFLLSDSALNGPGGFHEGSPFCSMGRFRRPRAFWISDLPLELGWHPRA